MYRASKLFALVSLFALGCTAEDGASEPNGEGADELIDADDLDRPDRPILLDPKVTFHPAPELLAVQPTATIDFRFSSCAEREWIVKRQTDEIAGADVTLLQLDSPELDCKAKPKERAYSVQITSDARPDDRYILLNPSLLTSASEEEETETP